MISQSLIYDAPLSTPLGEGGIKGTILLPVPGRGGEGNISLKGTILLTNIRALSPELLTRIRMRKQARLIRRGLYRPINTHIFIKVLCRYSSYSLTSFF